MVQKKKIELENISVNKISCEGQMIQENSSYILPVFLGNENNLLDVGVAISKNFRHWKYFPFQTKAAKR